MFSKTFKFNNSRQHVAIYDDYDVLSNRVMLHRLNEKIVNKYIDMIVEKYKGTSTPVTPNDIELTIEEVEERGIPYILYKIIIKSINPMGVENNLVKEWWYKHGHVDPTPTKEGCEFTSTFINIGLNDTAKTIHLNSQTVIQSIIPAGTTGITNADSYIESNVNVTWIEDTPGTGWKYGYTVTVTKPSFFPVDIFTGIDNVAFKITARAADNSTAICNGIMSISIEDDPEPVDPTEREEIYDYSPVPNDRIEECSYEGSKAELIQMSIEPPYSIPYDVGSSYIRIYGWLYLNPTSWNEIDSLNAKYKFGFVRRTSCNERNWRVCNPPKASHSRVATANKFAYHPTIPELNPVKSLSDPLSTSIDNPYCPFDITIKVNKKFAKAFNKNMPAYPGGEPFVDLIPCIVISYETHTGKVERIKVVRATSIKETIPIPRTLSGNGFRIGVTPVREFVNANAPDPSEVIPVEDIPEEDI